MKHFNPTLHIFPHPRYGLTGQGGKTFIAHNVEQKCKQIQNNK